MRAQVSCTPWSPWHGWRITASHRASAGRTLFPTATLFRLRVDRFRCRC
jgi:hypothetical protein